MKQRQPTQKPAAIVSCRVSTTKQEEEGVSLDSQARACVARAEELGYSVGRITQEVYTGGELDRPLLSRDIDDVAARRFQAVIVYSIDRLSRDTSHLTYLYVEME